MTLPFTPDMPNWEFIGDGLRRFRAEHGEGPAEIVVHAVHLESLLREVNELAPEKRMPC